MGGLHQVAQEHDGEEGEQEDGGEPRELGDAEQAAGTADVGDVVEDGADDLTEAQGHDGEVVALEPERGEPDEEPHDGRRDPADDDGGQEAEVVAEGMGAQVEQDGGDGAGGVGSHRREPHVPKGELSRDAVDEVEGRREDDVDEGAVDDDDKVAVEDAREDQDLHDHIEDRRGDRQTGEFDFIHAISPKSYRRFFRRECRSASGGGRR